MTSAKPDTARLFFAAWPPPEAQRALGRIAARLANGCGGRALPARNIHLTLAFLGEVARERLPELEAAAAGVTAPPFELRLDHLGYWKHNRVLWAGVSGGEAQLRSLASGVERALEEKGFRFDRRAYAPHVTLLRNARRAPASPAMPAVAWPVNGHALVESVPLGRGRLYRVLRRWPPG